MRIRCLRTGVVRERRGDRGVRRYLSAPWREETLPVNTFLVEHPDGLCLFDVGQTARATGRGYFPWWQPFFRLARFELATADEVSAQLRGFGFTPGDVRWIVLSHLHTDHVGGLEPFRDREVVVSAREWDLARGLGGRVRGYLPQYWPAGLEPRVLELTSGAFGPFPGSYDLSGDGVLVVVATPGHTSGHIALLVRRPEGDVLLGGDLAHSEAEVGSRAPELARYCESEGIAIALTHDWNAADLLESVDRAATSEARA